MKTQLVVLCLLALNTGINAQSSTFKVGGYYNTDIVPHKAGKISYPSWEFSYERALSKKFSINGSFNYAKRTYDEKNYVGYSYPDGVLMSVQEGFIEYDQTFILEGRYYLKSTSTGIFFQMGIPFTYTTSVYSYKTAVIQYTGKGYDYSISTFGGFGIKYPLTPRFGVEMNMSISPSFNFLDEDYGTAGFMKSGVKLFFSPGKIKTGKHKYEH